MKPFSFELLYHFCGFNSFVFTFNNNPIDFHSRVLLIPEMITLIGNREPRSDWSTHLLMEPLCEPCRSRESSELKCLQTLKKAGNVWRRLKKGPLKIEKEIKRMERTPRAQKINDS
jgi:hypothetical protein